MSELEQLAADLDDTEPAKRRAALERIALLAHVEGHRFEPAVEQKAHALSSDPDASVRAEAAVLLAILPGEDLQATLQTLERLLLDDAPAVRREAAAALGDLGQTRVSHRLAQRLQDDDPETRFEAAFALAQLGDERGLPLLTLALDDVKRRFDALEAMRRLKSKAPLEDLIALSKRLLLGWPERLTVYATRYAIGDTEAAEFLIRRTKSWNRAERSLALGLIGSHQVLEARAVVEAIAADPKDPLRENALETLGALDAR